MGGRHGAVGPAFAAAQDMVESGKRRRERSRAGNVRAGECRLVWMFTLVMLQIGIATGESAIAVFYTAGVGFAAGTGVSIASLKTYCMRRCLAREEESANALWQTSHVWGLSPVLLSALPRWRLTGLGDARSERNAG